MNSRSRKGVTLIELLIAMALSGVVLAGVFSAYLFISRSALRLSNYESMEREATLGLEQFGRELRMTQSIVTSGDPLNQITLTLPDATGTGTHSVVYNYNSVARTLTRTTGGVPRILIRDIQPGSFSFKRFDKMQQSLDVPGAVLPDYSTKQLQITLTIAPDTKGLVASTTKRVISSRFVLRNL